VAASRLDANLNGFGTLLNVMHDFYPGRDYQTAGPGNRAAVDGIWWCFRRADRFACIFDGLKPGRCRALFQADADAFCAWLRD
jgi:hypothetical protein